MLHQLLDTTGEIKACRGPVPNARSVQAFQVARSSFRDTEDIMKDVLPDLSKGYTDKLESKAPPFIPVVMSRSSVEKNGWTDALCACCVHGV